MSAYYQLLSREYDASSQVSTAHYRANVHAQGAWNEHEQHMAPATGVICAELYQYQPRQGMRIARIGLDIFGIIHLGEFSIQTRTIRAGKTIELIEASMQAQGKTCIVARAWKMQTQDSQAVAGLEDQTVGVAADYPVWLGMQAWPGGYIQSIEARASNEHRAGQGLVWLKSHIGQMVQGIDLPEVVGLMGLVDTANGVVPRVAPRDGWIFPNLDLQIHLYREPTGQWLGIQASQQYGQDGIALTSAILHDEQGPFGRSEQILTLRPSQ